MFCVKKHFGCVFTQNVLNNRIHFICWIISAHFQHNGCLLVFAQKEKWIYVTKLSKTPANQFSLWCAPNRDRRFLPWRASSWTAAWTAWIRCRPEPSRPECGGHTVWLPCSPEIKKKSKFKLVIIYSRLLV